MLACPVCGSRRIEINGRIKTNTGWTRCQDCNYTASPRIFILEDVAARRHLQRGIYKAKHFDSPDTGLVCPSCFQHERFEVDQVLLTGTTVVTESGWDVTEHPHTIQAMPDARVRCPLCGHVGRLMAFVRKTNALEQMKGRRP